MEKFNPFQYGYKIKMNTGEDSPKQLPINITL